MLFRSVSIVTSLDAFSPLVQFGSLFEALSIGLRAAVLFQTLIEQIEQRSEKIPE